MAPAVHGTANRVSKRQTALQSYAKISKSTNSRLNVEAVLKEAAISPVVNVHTPARAALKRPHSQVQDDNEIGPERASSSTAASKKPKLRSPTTPAWPQSKRRSSTDARLSPPLELHQLSLDSKTPAPSASSQEFPRALRDLISLHAAFLRAFTLHVVHNGRSAPADLNSLMASVTRLWKEYTVQKEDIQRMLAMYELENPDEVVAGQILEHKHSPFKLTLAGGDAVRHNVEYVGSGGIERPLGSPLDESTLQEFYELRVEALVTYQRNRPLGSGWLHGEVCRFPRLDFTLGVQTQARKGKAAAARREILGLSADAQNRPGSQFSNAADPLQSQDIQTPKVVKDRTLSLLERVRAKALASSTATQHSPEAIVRRYALGRIQEVVDILRMLQQRKLASNFNSSVHSSPGKVRGKVSLSMNQLVNDIRGSLAVPLGEAEIRMCINILANDVPGTWLSVYTVGKIQSVVLNGPGLSGVEVKKMLTTC